MYRPQLLLQQLPAQSSATAGANSSANRQQTQRACSRFGCQGRTLGLPPPHNRSSCLSFPPLLCLPLRPVHSKPQKICDLCRCLAHTTAQETHIQAVASCSATCSEFHKVPLSCSMLHNTQMYISCLGQGGLFRCSGASLLNPVGEARECLIMIEWKC